MMVLRCWSRAIVCVRVRNVYQHTRAWSRVSLEPRAAQGERGKRDLGASQPFIVRDGPLLLNPPELANATRLIRTRFGIFL